MYQGTSTAALILELLRSTDLSPEITSQRQLSARLNRCIFHSALLNKMVLTCMQIASSLLLPAIRDRPWQIQACCAKSGEGLKEGMEWLIKQVQ